jgi:2-methylcitrate dehydratase PrpD
MIEQVLAEYAVAERSSALPADVVHHAKRAVIDWFAALLPGAGEAPATSLVRALAGDLGHGHSVLYPSGTCAPARTAALINGAAAHVLEFDDIFRDAIYHPAAPTIAAALAAAQQVDATGDQFLRAVIAGYEISTRIGVALTTSHYKFWHTTGTVGTFGAAAAAGCVLGLDASQMAHAFDTSATFAAGLRKAFSSDAMSKPLHAGRAAEAGLLAALLAAEGVTGAEDMMAGPNGMGEAMSGGGAPRWEEAADGLGKRYNITSITFKNHGCCGHTFAAIDATLALKEKVRFDPNAISRITVETYKTAHDVVANGNPSTPFEAKFSVPFVVATALLYDSVRLSAFTDARLHDPALRDLMRRVEVRVDPVIDAEFPQRWPARVTIQLNDGTCLEHYQTAPKGDPDNPLTDAELEAKFRDLTGPAIGRAVADQLLDALWSLDSLPSARDIALNAVLA